jgi:hypothetical protein
LLHRRGLWTFPVDDQRDATGPGGNEFLRSYLVAREHDAVVPYFIEWRRRPHFDTTTLEPGVILQDFRLGHPRPVEVQLVLEELDLTIPVQLAPAPVLEPRLQTPRGELTLCWWLPHPSRAAEAPGTGSRECRSWGIREACAGQHDRPLEQLGPDLAKHSAPRGNRTPNPLILGAELS